MEEKNIYNRNRVLVLNVGQDDVDGLLLNWDLNDLGNYEFMESPFIDLVMNYLPEYAMGLGHNSVSQVDMVAYLRATARSVIKIKRIKEIKYYLDNNIPYNQWDEEVLRIYKSKGIFSELILHCVLREFKNTLPLISKIYFKDSNSVEAHGFDAVHVTDNDELWLGETKFYNDGKAGLKALIDDLNKHFIRDYLNEQFIIISRALIHNNEQREHWIHQLSNANRLEEKFKLIRIPLLCLYEDNIVNEIINEINNAGNASTVYFDHVQEMKNYFDANNTFPNIDKVQIVLILLPIESKDRIVSSLLSRIFSMQNI